MNVERSVEKLPDAMKRLIASDPAVKTQLERGIGLAEALADPAWAKAWLDGSCDAVQLSVLKRVLYKYGANPFEIERIEEEAEEQLGMTGAEARVAVAKLRRSGVLFAVRKSWGDRLFYVPSDAVALWQPLLLPADNLALTPEEAWEVAPNATDYRPPLALALLSAWHRIAKQPIARTAKGALQQAATARIASALRIEQAALAELLPAPPYASRLPSQAAFALDLGFACGVLTELDGTICIDEDRLHEWLGLPLREAERRLQRLVMIRHCVSRPVLHLTTSAALSLSGGQWHTVGRMGEWQSRDEVEARLALLEALGWIERGEWRGQAVIRRREEPGGLPGSGEGRFIVQPDGEILVPPDVGLRFRWMLTDIAELEKADELSAYRLTQRSCEEACRLGYSLDKTLQALKRGGGGPVPEPVFAALGDWFASLGRTEVVEALVLRADSKAVADALAADAGLAELIVERIGDRHFLIDVDSGKLLRAKLRAAGYPAADVIRTERSGQARDDSAQATSGERGWLNVGPSLAAFEADRELTGAEELFPGLADIPAAWITRPRKYHPSTSKELIRRAIEWQTAVHLESEGGARIFAPRSLRETGALWVAEGSWHSACGGESSAAGAEPVALRAEEVAELMIVLPDLEELETD